PSRGALAVAPGPPVAPAPGRPPPTVRIRCSTAINANPTRRPARPTTLRHRRRRRPTATGPDHKPIPPPRPAALRRSLRMRDEKRARGPVPAVSAIWEFDAIAHPRQPPLPPPARPTRARRTSAD